MKIPLAAPVPLARLSQNRFGYPLLLVGLFAIAFLGSFFFFKSLGTTKTITPLQEAKQAKSNDQEKQVACPLNGINYSIVQAEAWAKRRPLGIMIENHVDARPQSGLTQADIVYEASAEGGITRFLAMYLCQDASVVGPIRSARTYFLDFMSEYDGIYIHVGGAGNPGPADALGQIQRYGMRDIEEIRGIFIRDASKFGRQVAVEHTAFSSTQKLWEYAANTLHWDLEKQEQQVSWNSFFSPWQFSAKPQATNTTPAINAVLSFGSGQKQYQVTWIYDKASNTYKRLQNVEAHIDMANQKQLQASSIIIQFMQESRANDDYPGNLHLLYGTIGSGDAWIMQNGLLIKAKWQKRDRLARTQFVTERGEPISLQPGQIWIEVLPEASKGSVKIS